jgi:ubiquinone/menaquinone biosynthesis C-methylase UbiE
MAHRVCPCWIGYILASPLRRLLHNPELILSPFVSEGMRVLEPGPGMGFFTLQLARLVGPTGKVIAVDVQPEMLKGVIKRAGKAHLGDRIETRQTKGDRLGIEDLDGNIDFALVFAVAHEVPNVEALFADLSRALKPKAKLLLAGPAGHVKAEDFEKSVSIAEQVGFVKLVNPPLIRRSQVAAFERA